MFGHIVLAAPLGIAALFVSMMLIVIGTGLLKSNVSGMVGHLYSKEDVRRDAGFSIFYMGINIGGLLAPIIVGILGQNVNYHLGFSIAAIGMFIGLVQYYVQGKTTLKDVATTPTNPLSAQEKKIFFRNVIIVLVLVAVVFGGAAAMGYLTVDFFINCISILGIFFADLLLY